MTVVVSVWVTAAAAFATSQALRRRQGPLGGRLWSLVRDLLSVVSPVASPQAREGWKAVRVHGDGTLWTISGVSVGRQVRSPLREATARCTHSPHPAPRVWCTCGFHAARDRTGAERFAAGAPGAMLAQVALHGLVHENRRGFRASRQEVLELRLPTCRCGKVTVHLAVGGPEMLAVPTCDGCFAAGNHRLVHASTITAVTGVPVVDAEGRPVDAAWLNSPANDLRWLQSAADIWSGDLTRMHARRDELADAAATCGPEGERMLLRLLVSLRPAQVFDRSVVAGELLAAMPRAVREQLVVRGDHLGFVWRVAGGLVIDDEAAYVEMATVVHGPAAGVVVDWWRRLPREVRVDVPLDRLEVLLGEVAAGGRLCEVLPEDAAKASVRAVEALEGELGLHA